MNIRDPISVFLPTSTRWVRAMRAECWKLCGLKESELDSSHAWPTNAERHRVIAALSGPSLFVIVIVILRIDS